MKAALIYETIQHHVQPAIHICITITSKELVMNTRQFNTQTTGI